METLILPGVEQMSANFLDASIFLSILSLYRNWIHPKMGGYKIKQAVQNKISKFGSIFKISNQFQIPKATSNVVSHFKIFYQFETFNEFQFYGPISLSLDNFKMETLKLTYEIGSEI
jgi:hypothetical protein